MAECIIDTLRLNLLNMSNNGKTKDFLIVYSL